MAKKPNTVKVPGIKTWGVHSGNKKGSYEWSGEIKRIIPLKNNHCYIQDEKGKLHHGKRDSQESIALMKELDVIMQGKISKELEQLGWTEILEAIQ